MDLDVEATEADPVDSELDHQNAINPEWFAELLLIPGCIVEEGYEEID